MFWFIGANMGPPLVLCVFDLNLDAFGTYCFCIICMEASRACF